MKSIKVYGPGCTKCDDMSALVKEVLCDLGWNVPVEKVTDVMQFAVAGVIVTPALVMDGKVLVAGRVPSKDEMQSLLRDAVNNVAEDRPSPPAKEHEKPSCCCKPAGCCDSEAGGMAGKRKNGAGTAWLRILIWLVVTAAALAAIKLANRKARETDTETDGTPRTTFHRSGDSIEERAESLVPNPIRYQSI